MSKSIIELVDELPTGGITVMVLRGLDFAVPGQWDNLVGFENTVKTITGEDDPGLIQDISERALWLYNDKSQGYQRALWLYQTIDSAGTALGTAALANKISQNVSFLGFLGNLTPKADKAQAIDLSLKVVTELVAFCQINGIPGDSIGDFVASLANYGGESIMRMAALVCLDGLIPLGPDFIQKGLSIIANLTPSELEKSEGFKRINPMIPGGDPDGKLHFVQESFNSVTGWMSGFVSDHDLTPSKVVSHLQSFVDIADDKLDYVAAFLDMTTNYYTHTGIQTLARRLIERAYAEI
ncbi:MAG: hypothetical protein P5702_13915 [Limnospira sp. PMC 1291.21]|uniref:Uncharacterized protein n=1 Tax=Limnospira fusiformis PMC 851.14 TaxID=2219512 RepID=A0ABU9ENE2_LIMFS|nr:MULTISPECIES: hypothetical protein [unclassified Limnospira]MDY7054138.1 hypothetical protein [Limnospira fusiformis LS22]MDT9180369.1 hypothetical protein [Limnospira sp. PMC 1238.20]MDT9188743.1 hypothetical protein [Limnospira sp. PMC 894.15]MDT9193843.1 hypothetical protein [Limnospira sp. PMC 1245.20]MDT9204033.1 hypothetical protein [Limnospira sp. PMC 1243.20]